MTELITTLGYIVESKRGYLTDKNSWSKDFRKAIVFGYKEGAGDALVGRRIGWVNEIQDVSLCYGDRTEYEQRLIKL